MNGFLFCLYYFDLISSILDLFPLNNFPYLNFPSMFAPQQISPPLHLMSISIFNSESACVLQILWCCTDRYGSDAADGNP